MLLVTFLSTYCHTMGNIRNYDHQFSTDKNKNLFCNFLFIMVYLSLRIACLKIYDLVYSFMIPKFYGAVLRHFVQERKAHL